MSTTRVVVSNRPFFTAILHISEDYSSVEIRRSIQVRTDGGIFSPVRTLLESYCSVEVSRHTVYDPGMMLEHAELSLVMVYDECPNIPHDCAQPRIPQQRKPGESTRWLCNIAQ